MWSQPTWQCCVSVFCFLVLMLIRLIDPGWYWHITRVWFCEEPPECSWYAKYPYNNVASHSSVIVLRTRLAPVCLIYVSIVVNRFKVITTAEHRGTVYCPSGALSSWLRTWLSYRRWSTLYTRNELAAISLANPYRVMKYIYLRSIRDKTEYKMFRS